MICFIILSDWFLPFSISIFAFGWSIKSFYQVVEVNLFFSCWLLSQIVETALERLLIFSFMLALLMTDIQTDTFIANYEEKMHEL